MSIYLWIIPLGLFSLFLWKRGKAKILIWTAVAALVVWMFRSCGDESSDETTAEATAPAPVMVPILVPPLWVDATTPATIEADYGFNIEADGPIMVQYPGETPFLFDPHKGGCQQLPQPRIYGPKKFWDPDNPTDGHINFRLYRVDRRCK